MAWINIIEIKIELCSHKGSKTLLTCQIRIIRNRSFKSGNKIVKMITNLCWKTLTMILWVTIWKGWIRINFWALKRPIWLKIVKEIMPKTIIWCLRTIPEHINILELLNKMQIRYHKQLIKRHRVILELSTVIIHRIKWMDLLLDLRRKERQIGQDIQGCKIFSKISMSFNRMALSRELLSNLSSLILKIDSNTFSTNEAIIRQTRSGSKRLILWKHSPWINHKNQCTIHSDLLKCCNRIRLC